MKERIKNYFNFFSLILIIILIFLIIYVSNNKPSKNSIKLKEINDQKKITETLKEIKKLIIKEDNSDMFLDLMLGDKDFINFEDKNSIFLDPFIKTNHEPIRKLMELDRIKINNNKKIEEKIEEIIDKLDLDILKTRELPKKSLKSWFKR